MQLNIVNLQAKIVNLIPKDKLLHFCAGLLLAQLAYVWIWFIVLPFFVGLLKEIYDEYKYGGFDWRDLLVTTAGALPVGAVILISFLAE